MVKKQLPEDFKEFIKCLNGNDVKYLLLGGWAVGVYGQPRATKDIDFLVSKDKNNLIKLGNALKEFGSPSVNLNGFKEDGYVIRIGNSPILIEIINKADGIDIDSCYGRRKKIKIEDTEVSMISLDDLILNKKASGRSQDIADVEKLEKLRQAAKNNELHRE